MSERFSRQFTKTNSTVANIFAMTSRTEEESNSRELLLRFKSAAQDGLRLLLGSGTQWGGQDEDTGKEDLITI